MKIPRIIISAASSGSGKTLITIALIKALVMEGKKVSAFKTGPDYIDPLFHKKILGVPSRNLDLFFSDEHAGVALIVILVGNLRMLILVDPLEFHGSVFRVLRDEFFDGPVGLFAVGAGRKVEIGDFFHDQSLLSVIR